MDLEFYISKVDREIRKLETLREVLKKRVKRVRERLEKAGVKMGVVAAGKEGEDLLEEIENLLTELYLLKKSLERELERQRRVNQIVEGLKKEGTDVKIEDGRILLVFPDSDHVEDEIKSIRLMAEELKKKRMGAGGLG